MTRLAPQPMVRRRCGAFEKSSAWKRWSAVRWSCTARSPAQTGTAKCISRHRTTRRPACRPPPRPEPDQGVHRDNETIVRVAAKRALIRARTVRETMVRALFCFRDADRNPQERPVRFALDAKAHGYILKIAGGER